MQRVSDEEIQGYLGVPCVRVLERNLFVRALEDLRDLRAAARDSIEKLRKAQSNGWAAWDDFEASMDKLRALVEGKA